VAHRAGRTPESTIHSSLALGGIIGSPRASGPALFLALFLLACNPGDDSSLEHPADRAPGERAPLYASCDDQDPLRCHLPWPSSRFTVEDSDNATGLRVSVDERELPIDDDPTFLNLADGFSRITGLATGFDGAIDDASLAGSMKLFVAQPDHARYGESWPLRLELRQGGGSMSPETLLIGRPLSALPADADHVAVVLDSLTDAAGEPLPVERDTLLATGLEAPRNEDEAALVAYHAPTRALLAEQGIDAADVLRVWDFTTRSLEDSTKRGQAMVQIARAAGAAGPTVVIDSVEQRDDTLLAVVLGTLQGLPYFRTTEGKLALDEQGMPVQQGVHDVPFRVCIPVGSGDWPVAMYGHGTGGQLEDDAFDEQLAAEGFGKVNLRFTGWTGDEVLETFTGLGHFLQGSAQSTAGLLQALSDGIAVSAALDSSLGDALAAESLGGEPNPAAGRRPANDEPIWVGGSLGGTMGIVYSAAHPDIRHGVLNVPGAGWTHMIPDSHTWEEFLRLILGASYDDEVDEQLAMVMGQGAWDDVDGTAWIELAQAKGAVFLLQESVGDPILLNICTEILAASLGAVQIDPSLEDIVELEHSAGPVIGATALEQFRVPDTGAYDVHGFAARSTLAGDAALEQILGFMTSARAGESSIEHPVGCSEVTADGSCDFEGMW